MHEHHEIAMILSSLEALHGANILPPWTTILMASARRSWKRSVSQWEVFRQSSSTPTVWCQNKMHLFVALMQMRCPLSSHMHTSYRSGIVGALLYGFINRQRPYPTWRTEAILVLDHHLCNLQPSPLQPACAPIPIAMFILRRHHRQQWKQHNHWQLVAISNPGQWQLIPVTRLYLALQLVLFFSPERPSIDQTSKNTYDGKGRQIVAVSWSPTVIASSLQLSLQLSFSPIEIATFDHHHCSQSSMTFQLLFM